MQASKAIPVVGLLVFGTIISLTSKIVYLISSKGIDGSVHKFEKPWFQTAIMFAGMCFCFPINWLKKKLAGKYDPEKEPLKAAETGTAGEIDSPPDAMRQALVVIFPALADLAGTGLMMMGLVYTTVSVYQMLRGAQLLFCALLSIIFLKRKLTKYNWGGLILCIIGVLLVGMASRLNKVETEEEKARKADELLGFGLIILAQAVQATQLVTEEFLLQSVNMEPLQIVGWEGVWGTLVSFLIALPIFYFMPGKDAGSYENTLDSVVMIKNSMPLIIVEIIDVTGMLAYNYFAVSVTNELSAMHRTVFETMRTLFAWMIDLLLFYVFTSGTLGEPWEMPGSLAQALGFCVIVTGTFVYNKADPEEAYYAIPEPADYTADGATLGGSEPIGAKVRNDSHISAAGTPHGSVRPRAHSTVRRMSYSVV